MYLDSIKFSKLFEDKHGQKIFDEINVTIKKEKTEECNSDYIEAIFKVAFMEYFGLDNDGLNKMLEDINCNTDIKIIKKTHKDSIKIIQEYIRKANNESIDI